MDLLADAVDKLEAEARAPAFLGRLLEEDCGPLVALAEGLGVGHAVADELAGRVLARLTATPPGTP